MSGSSFDVLARIFLSGITQVQHSSAVERQQLLRPVRGRVPIVPWGIGAFCATTHNSLDALFDFGRKWRLQCRERQRRLDDKRVPYFILGVVGDILATKQPDKLDQLDVRAFSTELRQGLSDRLASTDANVEYSFPCRLFDHVRTGKFNIGPVYFWPRLLWLDHVEKTGGGSTPWVNIVRANWQTPSTMTPDIVVDKWRAEAITTGFHDCSWVATVTVATNELGRSDEWASILVRLGIDALAVPMHLSRATQFTIPGDKLDLLRSIAVVQSAEGKTGIWFSGQGARIGEEENAAEAFLQSTCSYRSAVGKALEALKALSPSGPISLLRRWCDALFWFGSARRDTTDFMALVHYGVTLDVLAEAAKAENIIRLLESLFGITREQPINGGTLKHVTESLYNQARSMLSHGTRRALFEDMPLSREQADQLAANALSRYICCLDYYDDADNCEAFLAAIPSLLTAAQYPGRE
jgi:hypothetical protein